MKEFKVNNYITLKLENNNTIIYVAGKRFNQCKSLAFHINIQEAENYENIESIDEMEQKYHSMRIKKLNASPEEEFWGHCSNLHAWAEHGYDTRILHMNLSFPLLRRLTEAGDPKAKRVFQEEIVKRYIKGSLTVRTYLIREKYLELLNIENKIFLIKEVTENKHRLKLTSWPENSYDERDLYKPFLKSVLEVGDQKFKQNFQKKIAKKYLEGNLLVRTFLLEKKFFGLLDIEDRIFIIEELIKNIEPEGLKCIEMFDNSFFRNIPEESIKNMFFDDNERFKKEINHLLKEDPSLIGLITTILRGLYKPFEMKSHFYSNSLFFKSIVQLFSESNLGIREFLIKNKFLVMDGRHFTIRKGILYNLLKNQDIEGIKLLSSRQLFYYSCFTKDELEELLFNSDNTLKKFMQELLNEKKFANKIPIPLLKWSAREGDLKSKEILRSLGKSI